MTQVQLVVQELQVLQVTLVQQELLVPLVPLDIQVLKEHKVWLVHRALLDRKVQ